MQNEKIPLWVWIIFILTGMVLLPNPLAVLMLPILPIMLAEFSTDAGPQPGYIIGGIIVGGYMILGGWVLLVYRATRIVLRIRKTK